MKYEIKQSLIFIEDAGAGLFMIRVVVDRQMKRYWQHESWRYNDCKSLARYFYEKHVNNRENPFWLTRAEKRAPKIEPHTEQGFILWLNDHLFEQVGEYGSWDTPMRRYIKETKETWTKHAFTYLGAIQNRPRWMDRMHNFCQDMRENPDVQGYQIVPLMGTREWDQKCYDSLFFDRSKIRGE